LYRAGSLKTDSRELARYKLDLVGVQRSDDKAVGSSMRENTHSSTERGMRIMN
jgi:hypothetical protein